MTYTPQLYPRRDAIGNAHDVGVRKCDLDGTYIGEIRLGRRRRMASGVMLAPVVVVGAGKTPSAAADNAIKKWNMERLTS